MKMRRRLDVIAPEDPCPVWIAPLSLLYDYPFLAHQEFVQWNGTVRTGVPSEEASPGCPREWRRFGLRPGLARQILPSPGVNTDTTA